MLTLRIKPKNIEETEAGTVNHGGRDLTADESPSGEVIKAGSTFEATEKWYKPRRHWHFLTVVDKTDETTVDPLDMGEEPEPNDDIMTELEADSMTAEKWDELEWNELKERVKDLGLSAGGSRDAIMQRLDSEGFIKG